MYSLISSNGNVRYNIKKLVCDTESDLATLPTCDIGSIAIVLKPSFKRFMKGFGANEWIEIPSGCSGDGSGSSMTTMIEWQDLV